MKTHKMLCHFFLACILLLCLSVISGVFAEETLSPKSTKDYGSGYHFEERGYYEGGVPGVGLFVGHPNPTARGDRALVRFNISPYILRGSNITSAKFYFNVMHFMGQREDVRKIEVVHLNYNAALFSNKDLASSDVGMVGTKAVTRADVAARGADSSKAVVYSFDVTKYVNEDIAKGNMYSSFRFRDVEAEAQGCPDLEATGVILGYPGRLVIR